VRKANEILNAIWQRKHRWMGNDSRHDGLLCKIIEGRMMGKPTRIKRRLQMLQALTKRNGDGVLKQAVSS